MSIVVKDLTHIYSPGQQQEQTALDHVSFRVEISGRGSTVLKKFDPQDYGAKMAYYAEPAFGAEFGGEYGEATNVINEEAQ